MRRDCSFSIREYSIDAEVASITKLAVAYPLAFFRAFQIGTRLCERQNRQVEDGKQKIHIFCKRLFGTALLFYLSNVWVVWAIDGISAEISDKGENSAGFLYSCKNSTRLSYNSAQTTSHEIHITEGNTRYPLILSLITLLL